MLDPKWLRDNLDALRDGLRRRGKLEALAPTVERWEALDRERRRLIQEVETQKAARNAASQEVARLKRAKEDATELIARTRALGDEISRLEAGLAEAETGLERVLYEIPNIPLPDVPEGGEERNVVVKQWGTPREADGVRPHWEVGEQLGILDMERGAKISGSMFPMFRGQGATLNRALCQLALDRNADAFEEIRPPTLVRTETMVSTGHLPKFEDDAYHIERDDLWAIPTAEVPLTSLARDELLDEARLPWRLMAHTSCFRREAGSAGRDTRGLLRVHEFDKVEILAYAAPEQAPEVHRELLRRAEAPLRALGLAYRVVDLCAGDLGAASASTFDLEVYAPGCDMWLEVSSVSWFSDYQARRANIRYRPAGGKGTSLVHTLNGSALAVPRVWAALVEANRQPDGSVRVPEALRPYCRGAEVIACP